MLGDLWLKLGASFCFSPFFLNHQAAMGSSASSSVSTLAETKVALGKLVSSYKAGFDKISLCDTHPKTNIEPENQSLKRRFLLKTLIFRLHVGWCSGDFPSPTIMDQVVFQSFFSHPYMGRWSNLTM